MDVLLSFAQTNTYPPSSTSKAKISALEVVSGWETVIFFAADSLFVEMFTEVKSGKTDFWLATLLLKKSIAACLASVSV